MSRSTNFSYKINNSLRYTAWWICSVLYCLSESFKRVDLKISHHKKKNCNYVWWQMLTRHVDYFTIYTNIKSLCYILGINTIFYVNFILIKNVIIPDLPWEIRKYVLYTFSKSFPWVCMPHSKDQNLQHQKTQDFQCPLQSSPLPSSCWHILNSNQTQLVIPTTLIFPTSMPLLTNFYIFILFMGFSRQECWSGLLFPPPGNHVSQNSPPWPTHFGWPYTAWLPWWLRW